jgi:hypothetical protein
VVGLLGNEGREDERKRGRKKMVELEKKRE